MDTKWSASPRRLSNSELIARVRDLAGRERQATATLVAHLTEFDERRLYLAEGYSCLFNYCVEVLHLSEHAAFNRIKVCRVARKFPLILDRLADGSLNLTTVRLIAPLLTENNHQDLVSEAAHLRRHDVERLVARMRPAPAVAPSVRRLPAGPGTSAGEASSANGALDFSVPREAGGQPANVPAGEQSRAVIAEQGSSSAEIDQACFGVPAGNAGASIPAGNPPPATPVSRRAKVAPLAADLFKVAFTADAATYQALCQARELLRHQIPDGDVAAVCGIALKLLVEKLKARKFGARRRPNRAKREVRIVAAGPEAQPVTANPEEGPVAAGGEAQRVIAGDKARPVTANPEGQPVAASKHNQPVHSRHIPAVVRHEVWQRDQGRCAFVGANAQRCGERGWLEFHHVTPFASGGESTADNLQLRCRAHNQYEAELWFGKSELVLKRLDNVIRPPA